MGYNYVADIIGLSSFV